METVMLYLLKSAVWITGFALVFFIFLRNERFFLLKRIFLIAGILSSLFLPFVTINYIVDVPGMPEMSAGDADMYAAAPLPSSFLPDIWHTLLYVWVAGLLFYLVKTSAKIFPLIRTVRSTDTTVSDRIRLVRASGYTSSFSFFSYVVVNPSVSETEAEEIMHHELVHIRQMHWLDLVLMELLCAVQWFNPVTRLYMGFIRQNHEYLADEGALQLTSDPAIYRAVLINQLVGSPVISLTNSFNYSLNKKRFYMMKNITTSPYRKLRILFILPVFALVLLSFATPEYRYGTAANDEATVVAVNSLQKGIRGIVTDEKGAPLSGAIVIIQSTVTGTATDADGKFVLENLKPEDNIVVSFVGFETIILKPDFQSEMKITLKRSTIDIEAVSIKSTESVGANPLVIIDGVESNTDISLISPDAIESISVLKDEKAKAAYGNKGKDGVIIIKTKQGATKTKKPPVDMEKDVFVVVEDMPKFPMGDHTINAAREWLQTNLRYPEKAREQKLAGKVFITFVIDIDGKVTDIEVTRSASPLLDAEAVRVVKTMPDWTPGQQKGKAVKVRYSIPLQFEI